MTMTRVTFYSNLADKQQAMMVLLKRLFAKKNKVTVMVDDMSTAEACCQLVWNADATSFMPSVLASDKHAEMTPIVFDWQENQLCHDDILINLSHKQLTSFSRFRQLIELVSDNEQDKVAARERFKFYRDRGYDIKHYDQSQLA